MELSKKFKSMIDELLIVGAEITEKAERNLHVFYNKKIFYIKNNRLAYDIQRIKKDANNLRGYLKSSTTSIEEKLEDQQQTIVKPTEEIVTLKGEVKNINRKITALSNNKGCCVIC